MGHDKVKACEYQASSLTGLDSKIDLTSGQSWTAGRMDEVCPWGPVRDLKLTKTTVTEIDHLYTDFKMAHSYFSFQMGHFYVLWQGTAYWQWYAYHLDVLSVVLPIYILYTSPIIQLTPPHIKYPYSLDLAKHRVFSNFDWIEFKAGFPSKNPSQFRFEL